MKLTNNLTLDSQLEKYRALGFDKYRLSIIIAGLAKGLDVSVYAKTYVTASQMHALRDGLILGFDMKPCVKAKLDTLSIREEIERLMNESNFDPVRRQKYHRCVSNIYVPLKAALDLQF